MVQLFPKSEVEFILRAEGTEGYTTCRLISLDNALDLGWKHSGVRTVTYWSNGIHPARQPVT